MRLISLGLCLTLLTGCQRGGGAAPDEPTEEQLVGKWKYDLESFRVELDPNLQAKGELESGKAGFQKEVAQLKADLKKMVSPLVMSFEADHRFSVTTSGSSRPVRGVWKLTGKSLSVVMDRPGQSTPQMALSSDGKRILTEFDRFGWGKSFAEMVKFEEKGR